MCYVRAKSLQTLCDPMNCSLPSSSVHGIPQARVLEWVVMPSSRGSSSPRDWALFSYVSFISRGFFTLLAEPVGKHQYMSEPHKNLYSGSICALSILILLCTSSVCTSSLKTDILYISYFFTFSVSCKNVSSTQQGFLFILFTLAASLPWTLWNIVKFSEII